MATTCKDIEKWRIRRETRKLKSSDKIKRLVAKKTVKVYKNKKVKKLLLKACKDNIEYERMKNEKEFNKKMDEMEKVMAEIFKEMQK